MEQLLVQAVILAAGRARRLGRIARQLPKCMLRVGGKPLVEHVAGALALDPTLTHVTLVVGPSGELAESCVRAALPHEVAMTLVMDPDQRGEMGSLRHACRYLGAEFLVSDANILYHASLVRSLTALHRQLLPRATAGVTANAHAARTHLRVHAVDDYARLAMLTEADHETSWVYTGVGVFRRSILDTGTDEENLCAVMARLIPEAGVAVVRYSGFYGHVATPFCLGRTRRCWSDHTSTLAVSSAGASYCT
jgi:NDP-sugar pyrophosphorylase family protein